MSDLHFDNGKWVRLARAVKAMPDDLVFDLDELEWLAVIITDWLVRNGPIFETDLLKVAPLATKISNYLEAVDKAATLDETKPVEGQQETVTLKDLLQGK